MLNQRLYDVLRRTFIILRRNSCRKEDQFDRDDRDQMMAEMKNRLFYNYYLRFLCNDMWTEEYSITFFFLAHQSTFYFFILLSYDHLNTQRFNIDLANSKKKLKNCQSFGPCQKSAKKIQVYNNTMIMIPYLGAIISNSL